MYRTSTDAPRNFAPGVVSKLEDGVTPLIGSASNKVLLAGVGVVGIAIG